MSKRLIIVCFLLAIFSFPRASLAEDYFNCARKKTMVDRQLCDNPALVPLDKDLNAAYKKLDPKPVEDQREWLRVRQTCHGDCLEPMYRYRVEALQALAGFDKQNLADRDAAFELLKSALACKPKPRNDRLEEWVDTFQVEGTPDNITLTIETSSVWIAGSAQRDYSSMGKRTDSKTRVQLPLSEMMLVVQESDGSLRLPCLQRKKCIKSNGSPEGQDFYRFSSCDEKSDRDVRDALNFLTLYARTP